MHVVPPEQIGAGEARIQLPRHIPDFLRLHQRVRLPPEFHFALIAKIPAIGHDAVIRGGFAGEVGGLGGAGDGGEGGGDGGDVAPIGPVAEAGGMGAKEGGGEADDVEDYGFLHG